LIGPNGSGKTTITKLLMGVFKPEKGSIYIEGFGNPNKGKENWKESIGILSGSTSKLFYSMYLFEQLKYYEIIYKKFNTKKFYEYLEQFQITHILNQRPIQISFGERIKFEFSLTLSYLPKILILDEPTVGLDPIAILQVRDVISKYIKETKSSGILTSHNLKDIAQVTDFYGFLKDGEICEFISKNQLNIEEIEKKYVSIYS
jgi:ABC-2 type transport system ATP-binding protein